MVTDGAGQKDVLLGQDFGFALKPGESIRIVRERLRQDLECHVPVELGVSGSIHFAL